MLRRHLLVAGAYNHDIGSGPEGSMAKCSGSVGMPVEVSAFQRHAAAAGSLLARDAPEVDEVNTR